MSWSGLELQEPRLQLASGAEFVKHLQEEGFSLDCCYFYPLSGSPLRQSTLTAINPVLNAR